MTDPDNITFISLYYSLASISFMLVEAFVVRWARHGKPMEHGDGIFVLHTWGKKIRAAVAAIVVVFALMPTLIFVTGFVAGACLSAVEGWNFSASYVYAICNILGVGPLVNLTPTTPAGHITDMVISCWAMLMSTTFMGFSASLTFTVQWLQTLHPSIWGLLRTLFLYIPVLVALLSLFCGSILAWVEGWTLFQGFLFMVGSLCDIEDPLTQVSPVTAVGNFFMCLCYLVELLFAGAIIGVVGGHPSVAHIMDRLQGVDDPPEEVVETVKSGEGAEKV